MCTGYSVPFSQQNSFDFRLLWRIEQAKPKTQWLIQRKPTLSPPTLQRTRTTSILNHKSAFLFCFYWKIVQHNLNIWDCILAFVIQPRQTTAKKAVKHTTQVPQNSNRWPNLKEKRTLFSFLWNGCVRFTWFSIEIFDISSNSFDIWKCFICLEAQSVQKESYHRLHSLRR